MNRRLSPKIIGWMRANPAELKEAYRQHFGTTEPPPPEPVRALPSTVGLTEKQAEVFLFICAFAADRGRAPTFTEMAAHMEASRSAVHRWVEAIEERGKIRRLPNRARAIEIVEVRP